MYAATLLSSLVTKHKSDNEVMKKYTFIYQTPILRPQGVGSIQR